MGSHTSTYTTVIHTQTQIKQNVNIMFLSTFPQNTLFLQPRKCPQTMSPFRMFNVLDQEILDLIRQPQTGSEQETSTDENVDGLRRATRQMQTYQFTLPENVDETQLTSSLNDQGILEFKWKTRDHAIENEDR